MSKEPIVHCGQHKNNETENYEDGPSTPRAVSVTSPTCLVMSPTWLQAPHVLRVARYGGQDRTPLLSAKDVQLGGSRSSKPLLRLPSASPELSQGSSCERACSSPFFPLVPRGETGWRSCTCTAAVSQLGAAICDNKENGASSQTAAHW